MIDLLFTAHNRLEYTRASFAALVANTNWDRVSMLHVVDDDSTDGTWQHLARETAGLYGRGIAQGFDAKHDKFGGPVAAMNYALGNCESEYLAKIDNDVIVCHGWLEILLGVLEANPDLDGIGMEPGFGDPVAPLDVPRTVQPARWAGGVGLFRTRVFAKHRPVVDKRFFGWTRFQREHMRVGWVTPALPVFLLDHIDVAPWKTLAAEYIARGWSRPWEEYFEAGPEYYGWWTGDRVTA